MSKKSGVTAVSGLTGVINGGSFRIDKYKESSNDEVVGECFSCSAKYVVEKFLVPLLGE